MRRPEKLIGLTGVDLVGALILEVRSVLRWEPVCTQEWSPSSPAWRSFGGEWDKRENGREDEIVRIHRKVPSLRSFVVGGSGSFTQPWFALPIIPVPVAVALIFPVPVPEEKK